MILGNCMSGDAAEDAGSGCGDSVSFIIVDSRQIVAALFHSSNRHRGFNLQNKFIKRIRTPTQRQPKLQVNLNSFLKCDKAFLESHNHLNFRGHSNICLNRSCDPPHHSTDSRPVPVPVIHQNTTRHRRKCASALISATPGANRLYKTFGRQLASGCERYLIAFS